MRSDVAGLGITAVDIAHAIVPGITPSPQVRTGPGEAGMTAEARRRIGRNLRLLYAEVLNQPLPGRFDALLADLAASNTTRGSS
ncbi:NepR family anti-sigma factor [Methylobacterium sp. M6A4_1b]